MNKKIIVILALAVTLIGGLAYYWLWQKGQEQKFPPTSAQPYQKGEVGYQEPQTTVVIGTEAVAKGRFVKVENGDIFFEEEEVVTQIKLAENGVILACTYQDLAAATELDYDQISAIEELTPLEMGKQIPVDEPIVVFTSGKDAGFRAHTVAMNADYCQY